MSNAGVVQRAAAPPAPPPPPLPSGSAGPASSSFGKNTVSIKLSDIKNGKFWHGPVGKSKQYTIQGGFHPEDYNAGDTLEFTVNWRRQADLVNAKSQEDLGLDVQAQQKQAAKAANQALVRANIGNAAITVGPSAHHHDATGDGLSHFVGQMNQAQTIAFVQHELRQQADQIQYVSTTSGFHRCVLRLSPTETIVFTYKGGNATVFHVGPGG
jgi:hypothetical protein